MSDYKMLNIKGNEYKNRDIKLLIDTNFLDKYGLEMNTELQCLILLSTPKNFQDIYNRYGIYYEGGKLRINNGPNYHQPLKNYEQDIDIEYDIVKILENFLEDLQKPLK